jgi:hypothetical protein
MNSGTVFWKFILDSSNVRVNASSLVHLSSFMSHTFLIFDFVLQVLQDQNLFDPQDIDTAVEALGSEVCTIYLSCML